MAKYKIRASFDGKNYFWIVVDNGRFIRNPTEKDLKGTKVYYHNETNVCPICMEESKRDGKELTDKSILYPGNTCRNIDKNGNKTDEYVCKRCNCRHRQRYDPNNLNNIRKSLSDCRTGNLDPNSSQAKGDNYEELTAIWLGAKRLSIEYDNYRLPLDHSTIPEGLSIMIGDKLVDLSGKVPETKGSRMRVIKQGKLEYECWSYNFINLHNAIRRGFEFDNLILYCASTDGKFIERIYIIPKVEITKRTSIYVSKNPTDAWDNPIIPWYEQYRVTDKEVLRKVNEIFLWEQKLCCCKNKKIKQ